MRTRILAAAAVATLAGLLLAAPAHATPVVPSPTPTPSPTATTPADPCALPTPSPDQTLEVPKVADSSPAPTLRRIPKLPLPVACFVEFKDLCEGETEVTLHNPIKGVTIVYQVAEEDSTRSVGYGESETTTIASTFSPFRVWIVFDGKHKLPIAKHAYVEPEGCQTASPSPSPSVSVSESPEPQLPVTGTNYVPAFAVAGGATVLLVGVGVFGLVGLLRRRRSAA